MSNTFHYNEVENGIELYLKKNNQKCSLNEWNGLTDVSQLEIVSIIENKVLENDPNFKNYLITLVIFWVLILYLH